MQHQRSDVPCPKKDGVANSEGMTIKQEQELRRRNRTLTDVEKWNEMYKILFPDDSHIPLPCKFNRF